MKVQATIEAETKATDYPNLPHRFVSFHICKLEDEGLSLDEYRDRLIRQLQKRGYRGRVHLLEVNGGPGRGNKRCLSGLNARGLKYIETFQVF